MNRPTGVVVSAQPSANDRVNAIGGEPLSTWFYGYSFALQGPPYQRLPNVQRMVFETFHQNPNPARIGESPLQYFCQHAPFPMDIQTQNFGTPEQKRSLAQRQEAARKPYIEQMGTGFQGLVRYGLRDKRIINSVSRPVSCDPLWR
jgi:hypothetical protein